MRGREVVQSHSLGGHLQGLHFDQVEYFFNAKVISGHGINANG